MSCCPAANEHHRRGVSRRRADSKHHTCGEENGEVLGQRSQDSAQYDQDKSDQEHAAGTEPLCELAHRRLADRARQIQDRNQARCRRGAHAESLSDGNERGGQHRAVNRVERRTEEKRCGESPSGLGLLIGLLDDLHRSATGCPTGPAGSVPAPASLLSSPISVGNNVRSCSSNSWSIASASQLPPKFERGASGVASGVRWRDEDTTLVGGVGMALDEPIALQRGDDLGHRLRTHVFSCGEIIRRERGTTDDAVQRNQLASGPRQGLAPALGAETSAKPLHRQVKVNRKGC